MTRGKFTPDTATLVFTAGTAITNLMQRLLKNPDDIHLMEKINAVFNILSPLLLKINLWECQNYYFRIGREISAVMQARAGTGDPQALQWIGRFEELGGYLGVKFS